MPAEQQPAGYSCRLGVVPGGASGNKKGICDLAESADELMDNSRPHERWEDKNNVDTRDAYSNMTGERQKMQTEATKEGFLQKQFTAVLILLTKTFCHSLHHNFSFFQTKMKPKKSH